MALLTSASTPNFSAQDSTIFGNGGGYTGITGSNLSGAGTGNFSAVGSAGGMGSFGNQFMSNNTNSGYGIFNPSNPYSSNTSSSNSSSGASTVKSGGMGGGSTASPIVYNYDNGRPVSASNPQAIYNNMTGQKIGTNQFSTNGVFQGGQGVPAYGSTAYNQMINAGLGKSPSLPLPQTSGGYTYDSSTGLYTSSSNPGVSYNSNGQPFFNTNSSSPYVAPGSQIPPSGISSSAMVPSSINTSGAMSSGASSMSPSYSNPYSQYMAPTTPSLSYQTGNSQSNATQPIGTSSTYSGNSGTGNTSSGSYFSNSSSNTNSGGAGNSNTSSGNYAGGGFGSIIQNVANQTRGYILGGENVAYQAAQLNAQSAMRQISAQFDAQKAQTDASYANQSQTLAFNANNAIQAAANLGATTAGNAGSITSMDYTSRIGSYYAMAQTQLNANWNAADIALREGKISDYMQAQQNYTSIVASATQNADNELGQMLGNTATAVMSNYYNAAKLGISQAGLAVKQATAMGGAYNSAGQWVPTVSGITAAAQTSRAAAYNVIANAEQNRVRLDAVTSANSSSAEAQAVGQTVGMYTNALQGLSTLQSTAGTNAVSNWFSQIAGGKVDPNTAYQTFSNTLGITGSTIIAAYLGHPYTGSAADQKAFEGLMGAAAQGSSGVNKLLNTLQNGIVNNATQYNTALGNTPIYGINPTNYQTGNIAGIYSKSLSDSINGIQSIGGAGSTNTGSGYNGLSSALQTSVSPFGVTIP